MKDTKHYIIAVSCVLLFLACLAWTQGTFSVTDDPICYPRSECQPDKQPLCERVVTCPSLEK